MGNVTLKFTIHAREFVKIVCASEEADAVQISKVAQKRDSNKLLFPSAPYEPELHPSGFKCTSATYRLVVVTDNPVLRSPYHVEMCL